MSVCTTEYITIITSVTITSTASTSIVYLPSLEYSSIVKSELNGYIIDKLYTQIGKVFRLPWELNLLLSCFGILAMYSRIYWNSWPSLQAWHPSTVVLTRSVRQGSVRFNLTEDELAACLFWSCYIIYLWGTQYTLHGINKRR